MVHPFEMKWYTAAARYLYSVFSRVKQVEEAPKIPAPVDISGAVTCRLLGRHTWSGPSLNAVCTHCDLHYMTHLGLTAPNNSAKLLAFQFHKYSANRANNLAGPK